MQICFFSRIVYFMAVSLTAGVFVAERKHGLLDRSLVAGILHSSIWRGNLSMSLFSPFALGVTMTEILFSHLFNMFTVIMGQTALVFVCMLLIFNIPCQGNLALAVFITCLQGFVGMCFGKFSFWNSSIIQIQLFNFCLFRFNNFRSINNHNMRWRSHSSKSFTGQFHPAFSYGRNLLADRRLIVLFWLIWIAFEFYLFISTILQGCLFISAILPIPCRLRMPSNL